MNQGSTSKGAAGIHADLRLNCWFTFKAKRNRMPTQLFVPSFRIDECLSAIRECLEKGWTGLGFKTVEFENAWKKYSDLPHAHFLTSNTAGLHLALHILKTR